MVERQFLKFKTLVATVAFCASGLARDQVIAADASHKSSAARFAKFDVKDFGARGDGTTNDTAAIQAAIERCASSKGGIVDLHDGVFLSGMIILKGGVELRIEPSATLKGSTEDGDYPDLHPPTTNTQLNNCRKALIYAESADQIIIDGGGTIDGSGANPNWKGPEYTRPMAVFVCLSSNFTMRDIQVKNAGMWGVVPFETNYVTLQNLNINTPFGPTRDGIDIVDGHHVMIENCKIFSEDDSICLKTGNKKGVFDVRVRNCEILQSSVANGLKLGTASTGSFKKISFEDISIKNTDKAALAVESVDGAVVDDINFHNIRFENAGSGVFILLGQRGKLDKIGSIQNISLKNVEGTTKHTWGSAISGSEIDGKSIPPEKSPIRECKNEKSRGADSAGKEPPEYRGQYPDPNLWGDLPASGFYLRHISGIKLGAGSVTKLSEIHVPKSFGQTCRVSNEQLDINPVVDLDEISGSGCSIRVTNSSIIMSFSIGYW